MLKKTITFEDLDGNPVTEDFYFHLSKAEVAEMEMSVKGGLTTYLQRIVAEEDGPKLIEMFKDLLTRTVGKRSEDGRRFIKNQEIIDDFVQSDAYSEMFIELASNAEQAAAFVNGIVPSSMQSAVQAAQAAQTEDKELPAVSDSPPIPTVAPTQPAWITENRLPTDAEIRGATAEQLQVAFQRRLNAGEVTAPPPSAPIA